MAINSSSLLRGNGAGLGVGADDAALSCWSALYEAFTSINYFNLSQIAISWYDKYPITFIICL